jgi:hypothetical protein
MSTSHTESELRPGKLAWSALIVVFLLLALVTGASARLVEPEDPPCRRSMKSLPW